jgi:class 3 adenylate cyclase
MDVGGWLLRLGLEQYETAFRENNISADLLLSLTAGDLKDIGITSVGHRRRLLDAIAALRTDAAPAGDPVAISASTAAGTCNRVPSSESTAERRQITILFCDLVGSTPLSVRLDPEDLKRVLTDYQGTVAGAITSKHGHLAHLIGDGALAYFGWPNADELHAESAVRAGLAIIDAVRPQRLRVRIGIATGLVVIGDLLGVGASQEFSAIGGTPNLAARLQTLAEPDTIVVSDATHALLGPLFELQDLGQIELKGFDAPQRAWRVERGTTLSSRSEALYAGALSPLIGRDDELDLLLRRWWQAKSGEGRLVLLCGEPGIGKSRLLAALEERLAAERHASLHYFCSPHYQDSPLHPIIARWEQEAGFARAESAEERLRKLEAVLAPAELAPEDIALVASLLSVPTGERYPQLDLNPQQRRQRTFAALLRRLISRARREPVLMLFEDAHWADPSSLELLDTLEDRLADLPVLLVISFRPEFAAPWIGRAGASLIALSRLDRRQSATLAAQVTGERVLARALLDRIVSQTDGVPLFIEELTKAVLETSIGPAGALLPVTVPGTLQASLMARLDRLPAAKQVAQMGAVIGREFSHALLASVASSSEAQLKQRLDELVASGLVFRRGVPPAAVYTFKHALVQEIAYESLLKTRRQTIHRQIAEALRDQFSKQDQIEPEIVAHHYAQAGLIDDSIAYYLAAGRRSAERSANKEAIAHYTRGLGLLTTKSEEMERDRQELELLIALGVPTLAVRGYMAAEVEAIYSRARELCDNVKDTPHRFTALRGLWNSAFMRKPLRKAQELSAELVALADAAGDDTRRALAHRALGCSLLFRGEFESSWEVLRQHIELWDFDKARAEIRIYGEDPRVLCQIYGAYVLWYLGYPDKATALISKGLAAAERLSNPHIYAFTLGIVSTVNILRREFSLARKRANICSAICAEHEFPQWTALAMMVRGRAHVATGRPDDGMGDLEKGWVEWQALGATAGTTRNAVWLAEACVRAGRITEGLDWINVAADHARRFDETYHEAEILRVHGELLLERACLDGEACLHRSMKIAQRQKAKSLELRTAIVLVPLWQQQGRRQEAYDLLASIYSWFTEGFDTPDLQQARALLQDLGAT